MGNHVMARSVQKSCQQFENEIVKLERAGFQYGRLGTPVFDDISLRVCSSDVVAVVGKSGVGKSTLLKIIARSLVPTRGIVNHSVSVTRPGAIAYMDQTSTVFPWKRTRQIIELALSRSPTQAAFGQTEVEHALEAFGLAGSGERYPRELSGGMKQRLALAFAVLRAPALLLLDEPFGSVDEFTRESLYLLLQTALTQTKMAVVLVTHNISECLTLADRVIVLGGRPTATVAGEFEIKGPKPRVATMLLGADFIALNKEIRQKISEI